MIKASTRLLGAGLLAASLAASQAARADHDDEGLAFIVGAAVGHVLSDGDVRVRHVHGRHYRHGPVVRELRWHGGHRAWHRKLHREHRRFHRYERRHDRWDRRHDRWQRRDDRRDDRWNRRHDRRDDRRHSHR